MEAGRQGNVRLLGELLVERGLLTEEELELALAEQRRTGRRLGEIAVARGCISGPALAVVLADQLGVDIETERGFGSGLWHEIARRHERGMGTSAQVSPLGLEERPSGRSAEPALRAPATGDALELVESPDPFEGVAQSFVELELQLEAETAARKQAERELAGARVALEQNKSFAETTATVQQQDTRIVLYVRLEGGFAALGHLHPEGRATETGAGGPNVLHEIACRLAEPSPREARQIRTAPPQDPIFGLHHDNLTERLTRTNRRDKAVVRQRPDGRILYVWITDEKRGYRVNVTGDDALEAAFPRLADALSYVNGEDNGALAARGRPLSRDEWPPEHDTIAFVYPTVVPTPNPFRHAPRPASQDVELRG